MLRKQLVNDIKKLSHFRIGLSAARSRLTFDEFLAVFEEGRKDNYAPKEPDTSYPSVKFENLSPETAENKLRAKVGGQADILQKVTCFFSLILINPHIFIIFEH